MRGNKSFFGIFGKKSSCVARIKVLTAVPGARGPVSRRHGAPVRGRGGDEKITKSSIFE
jgi:hypothetical protein